MLDSYGIKPGEALALSGSIHAELRRVEGRDGSAYASYAQTMALLNHHLPDVLQHVVANWQLPQAGLVISASTATKSYTDSLFDDTIAMKAPVNKEVFESNTEQVTDEGEMLEIPGENEESEELEASGDEELDESEEDVPLEAEDEGISEEPEMQEEAELESDEFEAGQGESEESKADELIYEDVSEGESYDDSETSMEDDESADYMNETEYENEPMEEEDPPWAEG